MFGLDVIGLKVVVTEWPVDDMRKRIPARITLKLAPCIGRLQPEIALGEAQRNRSIKLGSTAHDLGRVALDRDLRAVPWAIHVGEYMGLVVQIWLDVAGEEAGSRVDHPGGGDDPLRARVEHLVALEVAEPAGG